MNDEWEYSNPDYSDFGDSAYANQEEWNYSNPDYSNMSGGGSGGVGAAGGEGNYLGQLGSILGGINSSGLAGLLSAGTGLYDLFGSGSNSANGINAAAAAAADPFAGERGQYQDMLQNLMTNPNGLLSNDPAFQARLNIGLDATARQKAAGGYLGSGNMLEALQEKGQAMASEEMGNQFNRLALLSGAQTGSPGQAGSIMAGRYNQRNNALANIGGALGMGGGGGGTQGGGAGGSLGNIASSLSSVYSLGSKLGSLLGSGGSGGGLSDLLGGGGASAAGTTTAGGGIAGAAGGGAGAAGAGGAVAGEAGAAGAAGGGGTGAGGAALGATGAALLAAYLGYQYNERDSADQMQGAYRTLDRFKQAGVNPDYAQLYSMSKPWEGMGNANVLGLLAGGGELDQFSPQLQLNLDYANQLLASNPQLAALGVDMHDLEGDFQRHVAFNQLGTQRQAAQDEYDTWLRKYMYAPRGGSLSATQGGG